MIKFCKKWLKIQIWTFLANTFFQHPRKCCWFWVDYSGCFLRKSTFYGSSRKNEAFSGSILNAQFEIISKFHEKNHKFQILHFESSIGFYTSKTPETTKTRLPPPSRHRSIKITNENSKLKKFCLRDTAIVSANSSGVHRAPVER